MVMTRAQPRRQHLLETALNLFNAYGFHNVGVDLISKESGVSKTTLYKYYNSKEDLILGVLEMRNATFLDYLNGYIKQSKKKSPELASYHHIYAIFEAFNQWILSDEFSGCNFVNASAEYHNVNNSIYLYAAQHKEVTEKIIIELLTELPRNVAETLGKQIMMLLEGAIVTAQARAEKTSIDIARVTLNILLKQHYG